MEVQPGAEGEPSAVESTDAHMSDVAGHKRGRDDTSSASDTAQSWPENRKFRLQLVTASTVKYDKEAQDMGWTSEDYRCDEHSLSRQDVKRYGLSRLGPDTVRRMQQAHGTGYGHTTVCKMDATVFQVLEAFLQSGASIAESHLLSLRSGRKAPPGS